MRSHFSLSGLFTATLFMFCILFVSSCKKDSKPAAVSYSVKGLWEGTMTDANTQPFFLSLKSNGTCTMENISPGTQENLSFGTWSLNATSLTCNLTCPYGYATNIGLNMTFTGIFDSDLGTIKGSFHLVSPSGATDNGTFSLTKPN
jgi:hypothetical protein